MPPAYERDLTSTEDAARELSKFIELYPNSQYAEEVSEKLATVRERLADHEFFVATFYLKREEPRAAAMRLQGLLERFPGVGFDEEALFLLGKSYLMLGDVGQAVAVWSELERNHPKKPLAIKVSRSPAPTPEAAPTGTDQASDGDEAPAVSDPAPAATTPPPTLDQDPESLELDRPGMLGDEEPEEGDGEDGGAGEEVEEPEAEEPEEPAGEADDDDQEPASP